MKPTLEVQRVDDFEITGDGKASPWSEQDWLTLTNVNPEGVQYPTRAKMLYSDTGIYFLVDCVDEKLVCTLTEDFSDIYTEDVVEVFLWPDQSQNTYFEYEISPLEVQLGMIVTNNDGVFNGWFPWHFEGDRRPKFKTSIHGGRKESMAEVDGWSVEFFLPFKLFEGLPNAPPKPDTVWRGNICRIDYQTGDKTHWSWSKDTGSNFHDFMNFGTFKFC